MPCGPALPSASVPGTGELEYTRPPATCTVSMYSSVPLVSACASCTVKVALTAVDGTVAPVRVTAVGVVAASANAPWSPATVRRFVPVPFAPLQNVTKTDTADSATAEYSTAWAVVNVPAWTVKAGEVAPQVAAPVAVHSSEYEPVFAQAPEADSVPLTAPQDEVLPDPEPSKSHVVGPVGDP